MNFDELIPNKVVRTKLPSDLVSEDDIFTHIKDIDTRGKDGDQIFRAISQCKNNEPMYVEVLKAGYDQNYPWLDPNTEVIVTREKHSV